jgi:hypothetical protein
MKALRVEPAGEKHVRLTGLDTVVVQCLHELPEILPRREQPGPRERLYPAPTAAEAEFNADWGQLIGPDLHHLFLSAEETVGRDLAGLSPEQTELLVPGTHVDAWMNALNQARLILAAEFDIDDALMNARYEKLSATQLQAVLRIDLFGHLLHLFVELAHGATE